MWPGTIYPAAPSEGNLAQAFEVSAVLAQIAVAEERDHALHVRVDAVERVEFAEHAAERFVAVVEQLAGRRFERSDVIGGIAGALQANGVEPADLIVIGHFHKRRHVMVNASRAREVSEVAD